MHRRRHFSDPNVKISRKLSKILRHKAEEEGFKLMRGGFLYVDDLLRHREFHGVTIEQIQHIVDTNDKKRYTLETDEETGRLKICANQGHSLQIDDLDLKPIIDASEYPVVIHGTYEKNYDKIVKEGLRPMGRNHVHFAAGEPGEDGVISGMRTSCTVAVYLDLQKALKDGLKFYTSANNVILCAGNENGVIPSIYFDKIKNKRTGKTQHFPPLSEEETGDQVSYAEVPPTAVAATAAPATLSTMTADELADEMDNQKRSKRKNKRK